MTGNETLDALWQACSGRGELRLHLSRAGHQDECRVFRTPFLVIGLAETSDLVLRHPQVSRKHVYVQMVDGHVWCLDLGSRTGIRHDEHQAAWLDYTGIGVGPYSIQALRDAGAVADERAPENAEDLLKEQIDEEGILPEVSLEFTNLPSSSGGARRWRLDRMLGLIGHSRLCKVRMACPSVSRFHCSLLRTRLGLFVVDLLSDGGIFVNDRPVRYERLRDGDELRVGRFRIGVQVREAATAPPLDVVSDPAPWPIPDVATPALDRDVSGAGPVRTSSSSSALIPGATSPFSFPTLIAGPGFAAPQALQLAPTPPGAVDTTSPLVMTILQQFSAMQQQMFDQFQQSTLMMLQMFGTLHREQMDMVRQELQELREVTRALQELEVEIAQTAPSPPASSAGQSAAPARSAPQPRAVNGSGASAAAPPPRTTTPRKTTEQPAAKNGAPDAPTPAGPAPAAGATPSPPEDVHAWLCQRFAALDQERQSRWRKILDTIVGPKGAT